MSDAPPIVATIDLVVSHNICLAARLVGNHVDQRGKQHNQSITLAQRSAPDHVGMRRVSP